MIDGKVVNSALPVDSLGNGDVVTQIRLDEGDVRARVFAVEHEVIFGNGHEIEGQTAYATNFAGQRCLKASVAITSFI